MSTHATLTGADLHEPKGITTASADQVYAADGAGSGTWKQLPATALDSASVFNVNKDVRVLMFDDIGTAKTLLFPITRACTLTRIKGYLASAATGANTALTFTKKGGGAIGSMSVLFSGSAQGDAYTIAAPTNNTFADGDYILIATDGGATNTPAFSIVFEFTWTA